MMDEEQIGTVLAKAAAFDARTVGEADILAWMEAIGDLDFGDALAAVTRHYRESAERLRPAHLLDQVKAIRNERAAQRRSEPLALPSRFQADEIRDERIRRGVAQLAAAFSIPSRTSDDPRQRAIERARRERRETGREAPQQRPRRSGKPLDLSKVPGPAWASAASREQQSIAALHAAGRSCGRADCAEHGQGAAA